MSSKLAKDFIEWYKQKRPEYQSWQIKYFLPTIRLKITVPEGVEFNADHKLTKIIGLGFKPTEFKKIIHSFSARSNEKYNDEAHASFLFSENLWLVDNENKHHLIVGYILRKNKTLILLQFWLRARGIQDLIKNSPIGIICFPIEKEDTNKAFIKLSKIIQLENGEYELIIADLGPFKDEEPAMI